MLLGYAFHSLRHRRAGFVGAFVALLCAAALVCGCGMIMETGLTGSVAPERFAGAPVIVSGDQEVHFVKSNGKRKAKPHTDRAWISAEVTDRLRTVPGVGAVIPEVTFPAYLPGVSTDQSWGHGWESAALTPFTIAEGRVPEAADEIVVQPSTRLPVGRTVPVKTPLGMASYRVVGVTAQTLPHQNAVFFSTTQARRLAGHPGEVSAIGVFPKVPADVLRQALLGTTAKVHTGDGRGAAEFPAADSAATRLISMGASMGGTALMVGVLAVVGTFGLSIQQRSRELALMRAVAATPRQIRQMISREVLLIGLVAAPLGAVAGLGVGSWFHARLVGLGAIPGNLPLVEGPFAPLVAIVATVVAGLAAARISARRVTRIRPVEALGEAALQPPRLPVLRLLLGLVAIAGGAVLTLLLSTFTSDAASGPLTPATTLVWIIAVALLGPPLARALFAALGPLLRIFRPTGELAAANLSAGARRMASVITPLSLMVAMGCTMAFSQTTVSHAARAQARAGNVADFQVGPKAPSQVAGALRRVPGVRAVTEVLHAGVRQGTSEHSVQGVTPEGLSETMDLRVRSGSLTGLDGSTIAVAEGLGFAVGDTVRFFLPDGTPEALRVVAVYGRGLGFGDFTVSHDLLAAHVDVPFDDTVLVAAPPSARAALVQAVRPYPGTAVLSRAAAVAVAERTDNSTGVAYLGLALIVAFAAISVVNTLVMSVLGRARELALLRLVGATKRQVMRMICGETLVAAMVATVVGTAIAVAVLVAYSTGMTGRSLPYAPPVGYLGIVGGVTSLALLAALLPALGGLRERPVDVAGTSE